LNSAGFTGSAGIARRPLLPLGPVDGAGGIALRRDLAEAELREQLVTCAVRPPRSSGPSSSTAGGDVARRLATHYLRLGNHRRRCGSAAALALAAGPCLSILQLALAWFERAT